MGMLLAAVGLYGLVAFHVSRRTREIGVRMALGARSADVLRDVLGHGARLAAAGVGRGAILALGLGYVLRGLLVGTSPLDPLTYGVVTILLVAICLLASVVPARRAAVVDPIAALRSE